MNKKELPMSRRHICRLTLAALSVVGVISADVSAHGTVVDSRVYRVRKAGEQANLMGAWTSAMYDWAADSNTFADYADPGFSYALHVPDGTIASAGKNNGANGTLDFSKLNTPGAWPTSPATAGTNLAQKWTAPAPHNPSYFDVWITRPGFDVTTQSMGWNDLQKLGRWESGTSLNVTTTPNGGPSPADSSLLTSYDWTVPIPADRAGRVALVVVWQRRDPVGEAFFSVQDIMIAAGGPAWNLTTGGNYATSSNWTGGAVPNGVGAVANFGDKITNAASVSVGANSYTLGTLRFNSANAYTINGTGMLMLEASGADAFVDVQQGNHKIDAGLMLHSSTTASIAANASLALNGPVVFSSGNILTKSGAGTLRLNASSFTGASNAQIAVSNGTLQIDKPLSPSVGVHTTSGAITRFNCSTSLGYLTTSSAGTTVAITTSVGSPTVVKAAGIGIGGNTTINISNNVLLIDYTGQSVLDAMNAYAGQGVRTGVGLISGLSDPKKGVGIVEASSIGSPTIYLNTSIDNTTVIARYTLKGDTDVNGTVNFNDLVRLAQGYNKAGTWINGDSDYNGSVDFADLVALAQNYNSSLSLESTMLTDLGGAAFAADFMLAQALVPEPGTLAAIAVATAMLRRRR